MKVIEMRYDGQSIFVNPKQVVHFLTKGFELPKVKVKNVTKGK